MGHAVKKVWNVVSSILVALVVIFAALLVGARLFGLQVFTVLSGSMEPAYHTGSLIYVKKVDPATIKEGQAITFLLAEDTVATHRVIEVVPDEEDPTVLRFRTKGDANNTDDGTDIPKEDVVGKVVLVIPKIGAAIRLARTPIGMLSLFAAIILITELPNLIGYIRCKGKKQEH